MESCLTLLVIREMQNQLPPKSGWLKQKKKTWQVLATPELCVAGGDQNGKVTLENNLASSAI